MVRSMVGNRYWLAAVLAMLSLGAHSAEPAQPAPPVLGCPDPVYPAASAKNNESGPVVLSILIGVDGRVSETKVKSSSGYRDLDNATIDAISRCRFQAQTVAAWTEVMYKWEIAGPRSTQLNQQAATARRAEKGNQAGDGKR
jgi:TonB family protein